MGDGDGEGVLVSVVVTLIKRMSSHMFSTTEGKIETCVSAHDQTVRPYTTLTILITPLIIINRNDAFIPYNHNNPNNPCNN
jgi:hypothetical protein